jgi:putative copper export protein
MRASARAASFAVSGALMLFLQALLSHASDRGTAAIIIYFIHECAAGLWIGALLALWMLRRAATAAWIARAARFVSSVAFWSVIAIVISGIYTAYRQLGLDVYLLPYSTYGRTLLVKIAMFSAVLSLGAWNRARLLPEIDLEDAQKALIRNVAIESALLAILVIGLAAALANTPPARGHRMQSVANHDNVIGSCDARNFNL